MAKPSKAVVDLVLAEVTGTIRIPEIVRRCGHAGLTERQTRDVLERLIDIGDLCLDTQMCVYVRAKDGAR